LQKKKKKKKEGMGGSQKRLEIKEECSRDTMLECVQNGLVA
jgi:hypothetical protein